MINRAELFAAFVVMTIIFALLGWIGGKLIDYIKDHREQRKSRRPYWHTDDSKR